MNPKQGIFSIEQMIRFVHRDCNSHEINIEEEERRKSFFITSSNNIKLGLVTQRPLPSRKLDRERYTMAPSIKLVRPKNS